MSQEIEQFDQYPLDVPAEQTEDQPAVSKANPLLRLLGSARRHWLMVLLIWVFIGGPSAVGVWLQVKPKYTATGFVKVEPTQAIVFREVNSDPQESGFDAFLNTQAQEIMGSLILREAVADPTLKGLPLQREQDSVGALREVLTVAVVPRTHLLRVAVKQDNPEVSKRLTQAVLRAYKAHAGGVEAEELKHRRSALEEARQSLSSAIELKQKELYSLAQRYGATTDSSIASIREIMSKNAEEAYRKRDQAQDEKIGLSTALKSLESGVVPTTMPGEELVYREQLIENDITVRNLRSVMESLQIKMLTTGRTQANVQLEARTQAALDKALAEATAKADAKVAERRKRIETDTKAKLNQQLAAAESRYDVFNTKITELEQNSDSMGRTGLEIKKLQDQLDSIDRNYKVIQDTLGKMEVESRRPERITVDDTAEILPDGREDKRVKLMLVAAMGALFLGFGLAHVRDLVSGKLYTSEDVQSGMGLRLLGALPALADLRRGKITEDDFRESYRTIRATLAGSSPQGIIPKTLLVTSAQAAEGKTSLAISLAASLAETGCRVLIIDGDVQAPRIAYTLQLKHPHYLRSVLLGQRKLEEAVGSTPVAGLDVLLSGRNGQSASGVLNARVAQELLKHAAESYDHIVVDSPPVLGSADALIWAQVVDGVIVSSLAGHSSHRITRQACERLAAAGGHILGAVMCNVSLRESYHSYSSYASNKSAGEGAEATTDAGSPARRTPIVHLPAQAESPGDAH